MKITITNSQADTLLQALEWAVNPDFPDTDPTNAKYIRLENKIRREMNLPLVKTFGKREQKRIDDYADNLPMKDKIEFLERIYK